MGSRERHEARSTAALLQERFRELQRKKEMREERQLLKILTPSNMNTHELPSRSYVVNNPSSSLSSPPHVSLSLWPASDDKQEFHTSLGTSSANMSSNHSYSHSSANNVYDCGSDSGVDTSLHL